MTFRLKSRWVLVPMLAALLTGGSVAVAVDTKASRYYEDALIRYEKRIWLVQ